MSADDARSAMRAFAWRHVPHAIFFFSCACIMVVELVAGRLIASHLGSSLYTWTAVIAVMLAGIARGNVTGGRLADRHRPEAVLGWLLLGGAAACLLALALNAVLAAVRPFHGLNWPLQILLSVLVIFLAPAAMLGTLSPSLAKMAVDRGRHVGSALGSFYACGTVGSIVGTFLTGFWLLFALGNTRVVVLTATVLGLLGVVVRLQRPGRDGASRDGAPAREQPGRSRSISDVGRVEAPMSDHSVLAWRYAPHAIAFAAAACLMMLELLASRVIAEQAGTSLYTWTSVIGVVFLGMSIGNYLGGELSDRFDPARFLAWLFLAASASVVAVLVITYELSLNDPFARYQWPTMVFGTVLCIFLVPSLLLGTFGPAATRIAVVRARAVGATIGSVSAWNAAGSIAGTLVAGFWLIPLLGVKSLTVLVACLLAGGAFAVARRRAIPFAWTVLVVTLFFVARTGPPAVVQWRHHEMLVDWREEPFNAESAYQFVRVYDDVSDEQPDRRLRVVALDALIHGYVDLNDPSYLNYGYERVYADVARRYVGDRPRVSAFFVGGGSYTFPRWVLHEWPGSRVVVAEIDPMVLEANHRATGLPRNTPIRTILGDARNVVDDLPADARFDFVFGDAFNDLAVPYHLTTLEFTRKVAGHLRPDGVYVVNMIDKFDSGQLLGAFVGTMQRVFSHVYVFCSDKGGVGKGRDTFVIAGSNVAIDTSGWEPGSDTDFQGSLLTRGNVAALLKKCGGRILTDDNAPVENLIAPVVRERSPKDR